MLLQSVFLSIFLNVWDVGTNLVLWQSSVRKLSLSQARPAQLSRRCHLCPAVKQRATVFSPLECCRSFIFPPKKKLNQKIILLWFFPVWWEFLPLHNLLIINFKPKVTVSEPGLVWLIVKKSSSCDPPWRTGAFSGRVSIHPTLMDINQSCRLQIVLFQAGRTCSKPPWWVLFP